MKIIDLVSIASKSLKVKWAVLSVVGIAVSTFCLCFAGAILITVQEEKAQPYEIIISGEGANSISDNDVIEISKIEDVTAATPVLQIPVSISTGDYTVETTLTAIESNYLEGNFSQGGFFPDDSIMPYIVLNEAACKLFLSDEKDTDNEVPDIDWLGTDFFVQMGEEAKTITSKVCGVLSNEDEETEEVQEPAAYISLSMAKELLRSSGQRADYMAVYVRIANIGFAQSASKGISTLGFPVTNSNEELQAEWDTDTKEMIYLIVVGAFCLLCAAILMAAWRKISMLEQRRAWEALHWMGLKASDMHKLFAIQTILLSLFGIALGLLVALSLPSFLSTGEIEKTNFMLALPFKAVIVSVIICIAAGMLPIFGIRKQIKNR